MCGVGNHGHSTAWVEAWTASRETWKGLCASVQVKKLHDTSVKDVWGWLKISNLLYVQHAHQSNKTCTVTSAVERYINVGGR